MRLILLRHGQTLFNELRYTQGYFDSPLTALGIAQAKRAREVLKNVHIDQAYSSYSERAYDTTEIALGNRGIKVIRDKRLKEFNFGLFEGGPDLFYRKLIEQIKELKDFDASSYGGDSPSTVINRQLELIEELNDQYPDDTILLGGHGCSLMVLYKVLAYDSLIELDPNFDMLGNCEAMKIEYRGIGNSKVLNIYRNDVK